MSPRIEMDIRRSASFELGDVTGDICHRDVELLALLEIWLSVEARFRNGGKLLSYSARYDFSSLSSSSKSISVHRLPEIIFQIFRFSFVADEDEADDDRYLTSTWRSIFEPLASNYGMYGWSDSAFRCRIALVSGISCALSRYAIGHWKRPIPESTYYACFKMFVMRQFFVKSLEK